MIGAFLWNIWGYEASNWAGSISYLFKISNVLRNVYSQEKETSRKHLDSVKKSRFEMLKVYQVA